MPQPPQNVPVPRDPPDPRLNEDLYEPTSIRLFGKPFLGLQFDPAQMGIPPPGWITPAEGAPLPIAPGRWERALMRPDVQLARIYSFSYDGQYYTLPRPTIFLVRGNGVRPDGGTGVVTPAAQADPRFHTHYVVIAAKDWQFADDIL